MKKELTPWQRTALTHPHDVDIADELNHVCVHLPAKGRSVILTCDIDIETAQTFGGPVCHLSVWPPSGRAPQPVLSGVGEGTLFDEPGVHSKILHLRRRMTTEEMKRLGDNGQ